MVTIQDNWNAFDKWVKKYEQVMKETEAGLHIWDYHELQREPNLSRRVIRERKTNRIQFLIAYLADLKNDGPEFMKEKGIVCLSHQLPKQCDKAYGIWLWMKRGRPAPNWSLFFSSRKVSIFAPEPYIMDWFSMHFILPFDHIAIRAPHGEPISRVASLCIEDDIHCDFRFDGMTCKTKTWIDKHGICRIDLIRKGMR